MLLFFIMIDFKFTGKVRVRERKTGFTKRVFRSRVLFQTAQ